MKVQNSKVLSALVSVVFLLSLFTMTVNASETDTIDMTLTGRYDVDEESPRGGLEIVTYNSSNEMAYAIDGINSVLIAIPMSYLTDEGLTDLSPKGLTIDLEVLVETDNPEFAYGDITSITISPDETKLAVAIQAEGYNTQGIVAVFPIDNSEDTLGTPEYFVVGVQPDMVIFANDTTLLSADEGEPRMGYGTNTDGEEVVDPKGSISTVNLTDKTVTISYFDAFDAQRDSLVSAGVLMNLDSQPSVDLEPEYITVTKDGMTAYVALQENNAIAVVDVATAEITSVLPLGFKSYSDAANAIYIDGTSHTYDNLLGAYMPDGISIYEDGENVYIITANEGDGREWSSTEFPEDHEDAGDPNDEDSSYFSNETKITLTKGEEEISKVLVIDPSVTDGLPADKNVMFGGRSFTLFKVTDTGLEVVYDSGSDFEDITSKLYPDWFNTSNTKLKLNDRSKKKGPEPENVAVGEVDGRVYAFIVLERIGGVMAYDITDVEDITYATYINTRDFTAEKGIGGDSAPEGVYFISSTDNPTGKALLIAGCEVTGTMPVYTVSASAVVEETTEPITETTTEPISEPTTTNYTVVAGDTLYKIAAALLGDGDRYMEIYDLNQSALDNPNLIYAGDVIKVPAE